MSDTKSLRTGAGYALEVGLYATHKAMTEAADTIDTLRAALSTQKTPAMNDNAAAPLSDGRILGMWPNSGMPRELIAFARCVEAAHGIGNGGMSEFRCVRAGGAQGESNA